MEFLFHERSPAVRFTCDGCGGSYLFKTKYLEIGELYPCPACRTMREFTFGDAFLLKDLRNDWAAHHPDSPP